MQIKPSIFLWSSGLVFLIVAPYAFLFYSLWPIDQLSIDKYGVFGDSFGVLTSLFSGLAFAGLIIAILIQKQELVSQHKTMQQQRFESTFFQMIAFHNGILRDVYFVDRGNHYNGIKVLRKLRDDFIAFLETNTLESIDDISQKLFDFIEQRIDIGHYFRNFCTTIKFVDDSSDIPNKKSYTDILRSQLSGYELFFIFYYCVSSAEVKQFKSLVEKYSLLKTLPEKLILDKKHKEWYDAKAFK